MELLILVLGLAIFLGAHSLKFLASGKRAGWIETLGERRFKGRLSLVSLLGLVLIGVGYAQARLAPVVVWVPPPELKHWTFLLVWLAFMFILAAFFPGNEIKPKLHHPMIVGVKTWAIAHLMANGLLHQMVLFGAFLIWAVLSFIFARKRDRLALQALQEAGLQPETPRPTARSATGLVVSIATLVYLCFLVWGHQYLIGVNPLHGM